MQQIVSFTQLLFACVHFINLIISVHIIISFLFCLPYFFHIYNSNASYKIHTHHFTYGKLQFCLDIFSPFHILSEIFHFLIFLNSFCLYLKVFLSFFAFIPFRNAKDVRLDDVDPFIHICLVCFHIFLIVISFSIMI